MTAFNSVHWMQLGDFILYYSLASHQELGVHSTCLHGTAITAPFFFRKLILKKSIEKVFHPFELFASHSTADAHKQWRFVCAVLVCIILTWCSFWVAPTIHVLNISYTQHWTHTCHKYETARSRHCLAFNDFSVIVHRNSLPRAQVQSPSPSCLVR